MKQTLYIVAAYMAIIQARPAGAVVHTVTSTADDGGGGTLRYIVETAAVAGDTI